MSHPHKLSYNPEIAKKVKEQTRAGVPVRTIFASIQKYQDAPGSYTTFYKLYREDMELAKGATIEAVGNKVVDQALNGDPDAGNTWKAREFYLRTQGGWTPKETVETREIGSDDEEEESAINALMKALGKDASDSE
jgi:hypothetical protein